MAIGTWSERRERVGFALTTTKLYGVTTPHGPVPHSSSGSCDLLHQGSPAFLRSEEIRNEIYAYMAGTLKNLDCHPIKIGGVEDHVHVFSSLSKNIAFSDLIGRLKGASSKRLKEKGLHGFGWQNGYGAFSVSESNVESVMAYIINQVEHHKKFSYQEENS